MIPLQEAEKQIAAVHVFPETEQVPLGRCCGRVLAEPVISPLNMPPFNKSAMDGYAINSKDTSGKYTIIEVIPAGKVPEKTISRGTCAKIMTGAMVPKGADRVVIKEVVKEEKGEMTITGQDPHTNICLKGEDVKKGDIVLGPGTIIRPQETGVIASMGNAEVTVYKAPVVGIIATGSELVMPGKNLGEGQIYNSNSFSLAAQAAGCGAGVVTHGLAVDTEKDITQAVASLETSCDMILLSGGVSMGDYDFVPGVLRNMGVTILFEKIAVKPGKPTLFGTKGKTFFFGVPGNPVSTFVIFEILIKPLLYRMMGHCYSPRIIQGVLQTAVKRKRVKRSSFMPVRYYHNKVTVLEYHGSAHINALTEANGLITIPRGTHEIPAQRIVDVRMI